MQNYLFCYTISGHVGTVARSVSEKQGSGGYDKFISAKGHSKSTKK